MGKDRLNITEEYAKLLQRTNRRLDECNDEGLNVNVTGLIFIGQTAKVPGLTGLW